MRTRIFATLLWAVAAALAAATLGPLPAEGAGATRPSAYRYGGANDDRLSAAKALPRTNRLAPRVSVKRRIVAGAAYSIENLSPSFGDDQIVPMGIDAAGRILIYDQTDSPTGVGAPRTESLVINADGSRIGLPCICNAENGYDTVGYAISANSGEVAGYFDYEICCRSFMSNIVWGLRPSDAFIDYFDGYRNGDYALGVNDAGLSVGEDVTPNGNFAVIFSKERDRARTDLLPVRGATGCTSVATGINDAGTVIGNSCATAVIFSRSGYAKPINVAGDSFAAAINTLGHIAGSARNSAFIYRAGHTTYLPRLSAYPNASVRASALNDADEVVGYVLPAGTTPVAIAYIGAATYDLNAFLPAGSGWQLAQATGVNVNGQIVGLGYYDGTYAAFLLTPTHQSGAPAATRPGKALRRLSPLR